VFRDFGFAPIETPAIEYSDVLLGKLDPDTEVKRQIYRFRRTWRPQLRAILARGGQPCDS
jgi:histidyl-tRNA synthetase